MILLVLPKLLRKNFGGIALWPFIVLRHQSLGKDSVFMNHERIHLRQQVELLIVFFYLWYGVAFLWRWIPCRNRYQAYRNICFEREAYGNENNLQYLKNRPFWGFLKFM